MYIKFLIKNKIFSDSEILVAEDKEHAIDFSEANSKLELLIKEKAPW